MLPRIVLASLCSLPLVSADEAIGATLMNSDAESFMFIVTERGVRTDVTVLTGQTIEFCLDGCFVALPNADRATLTGTETIEISRGRIKAS